MLLNIKDILILILFLSSLNYTHAQKQKTDLSLMNLLGKVETISHIEYSINNDNISMQEASFLTDFDTKGYILEQKNYNRDLNLTSETILKYDKNYHSATSLQYIIPQILDNGLPSTSSRQIFRSETTYKEGLIEIISYAQNGALQRTAIYTFNKKGQKINEEIYIEDHVLMSRATFKHFKKKILIKRYNKDSKLTLSSIQKLDRNGNVILWSFPASNKYKKYEYKYDDQNNWIQKITYRKDKVISKIERKINYY